MLPIFIGGYLKIPDNFSYLMYTFIIYWKKVKHCCYFVFRICSGRLIEKSASLIGKFRSCGPVFPGLTTLSPPENLLLSANMLASVTYQPEIH